MTFDEIMMEITSGLTGDREHDLPYLQEQCEKYKEHDLAQEILRACGRLIYKYVTNEQRAELDRIVENQGLGHEAILEEVRFKAYQKKYDEAIVLIEGLIAKIELPGFFTDDTVSEYHTFHEFFEEALYKYYTKPTRTIRHATFPFDVIYLQYGSLLVDVHRFEDAKAALEKALRWNPASADIAFEHAETYKLLGDMDGFLHHTIKIFRYAFRPQQVARCYRNLGYYFAEKTLWKEAVACYSLSLHFEKDSKNAMSELYYIHENAGNVDRASMEEIRALAQEYGFPVGAHEDVVGMAFAYGKHFLEQGDSDAARYCLIIAFDLTQDEAIRNMIDSLPEGK